MSLTHSNARVTVDRLDQLLALVANHPVRVNLRGAFGVQGHHLELPEVCLADVKVFGAYVVDVGHVVLVEVIFASITTAVAWGKYRAESC